MVYLLTMVIFHGYVSHNQMVYEFSRAYRLFSAGFRLHLALADLVSHACEIQIDETSGVAGHGYLVGAEGLRGVGKPSRHIGA